MKTHLQALPENFMLQEYQIGRVLGAGGFGLTYLGWDTALNKAVAIKEYLPNELAVRVADISVRAKSDKDKENFNWGLTRFIEEARTLASFNHPNIVGVHRFFQAHNTAYIVMEYVEGETLSALLKREGTISEARLLAILKPLLAGLQEVHAAGFLHRDIKPSNIIIRAAGSPAGNGASAGDGTSTSNGAFVGTAPCGCPPDALGDSAPGGNGASAGDGSPVLVDFGSARQAVGARSLSITAVVTPGYAPLEQYSTRGKQGAWTDIYALGALAYRALTGNAPPDATERVVEDEIKPLAKAIKGKCTAALLRAIDSALAVKESDRPRDIAEWRAMLGGDDDAYLASEKDARSASSVFSFASPENLANARAKINAQALAAKFLLGKFLFSKFLSTPRKRLATFSLVGTLALSVTSSVAYYVLSTKSCVDSYFRQSPTLCTAVATLGHAEAQANLGRMYDYGWGVQENGANAIRWYRKAAEQGHAKTQYNLGWMYRWNNHAESFRWWRKATLSYRKAAERGDAKAQNRLGRIYYMQENYAEAARWYRKAAEQGVARAQYFLGRMYYKRENYDARWWRKYAKDEGVQMIDFAESTRRYRKSAEHGNAEAQYNLGWSYGYGVGVQRDDGEAARWMHKAAEQGHANAQYVLGELYHEGRGVQDDDAQAARWYRKAAEQGHAEAQYKLGWAYSFGWSFGWGVARDRSESAIWYRKAAEQGHADAQYKLGELYHDGRGVHKDYAEAVRWYSKAAVQGNERARYVLRTHCGFRLFVSCSPLLRGGSLDE